MHMSDTFKEDGITTYYGRSGKGESIIKKFEGAGIPYFDIDPEMIEIIHVLNFELGVKTKFCCYGHAEGELTYIMFDESESDENVIRLIKGIERKAGSSIVSRTKLYKWARTMYQRDSDKPHKIAMNWIFDINYVSEELRQERLDKVTKAFRTLIDK